MGKYRIYKPEFKAEVVLESLRGQKTDAQICREHEIAPDLLSRWRKQFLERAPQLFATDQTRSDEQAKTAELERLIGRLTGVGHSPAGNSPLTSPMGANFVDYPD